MSKKILGPATTNYTVLCHYTGNKPVDFIRTGSYWTTFLSGSPSDASRMTGVPVNLIRYRCTVHVNSDHIHEFFSDAGTKWGPMGYGAALEFRNKAPIDFVFLDIEVLL